MTIDLNLIQTMGISVIVFYLGHLCKLKINFFRKYCIPAPVIGGLFYAILMLIFRKMSIEIIIDTTLQSFCMIAFFTSIGFTSSLKTLLKGGKTVIIFLLLVTILGIIQNIIGISLASKLGLNPLLGLALGSISLTGGHGTSGAFGPQIEALGATSGLTVAIAAATFGLIVGGIVGGPVAKRLILKKNIIPNNDTKHNLEKNEKTTSLNLSKLMLAISLLFISMGIGTLITKLFTMLNITVPEYVGGMIVAAIIRNIIDRKNEEEKLPIEEISIFGSLNMNFFLALAMMGLKLWELLELAMPMIIILVIQTVITIIFAYFITFAFTGKGYDGALFATAHCGLGLGVTATAIANMDSVCDEYVFSPRGYFVVPLVGGLFLDFTNSFVILTFMNLLK